MSTIVVSHQCGSSLLSSYILLFADPVRYSAFPITETSATSSDNTGSNVQLALNRTLIMTSFTIKGQGHSDSSTGYKDSLSMYYKKNRKTDAWRKIDLFKVSLFGSIKVPTIWLLSIQLILNRSLS